VESWRVASLVHHTEYDLLVENLPFALFCPLQYAIKYVDYYYYYINMFYKLRTKYRKCDLEIEFLFYYCHIITVGNDHLHKVSYCENIK